MEIKLDAGKLGEVNTNGRVYPTHEELRQKKIEDMITFNSRYGSMNSSEAALKGQLTVEQLLQWNDIFPEIEYSKEVEDLYMSWEYLTPIQACCSEISVFVEDKGWLHPRHWRFNHKSGIIVFLCHDRLVGEKITMNASTRSSMLVRKYMSKFDREGLTGGIKRGTLNIIDSLTSECKTKIALIGPGPYGRPNWKELLAELKGVNIVSHPSDIHWNNNFLAGCVQFEDDRPMTVRGNSRQKLVDNGKGKSWPEARTRKGRK
ncbi:hypothetical protein SUREIYA_01820 [Serratia phage vB_SmaM-Sureiya]|nr:hypothetical protein SUREIYA_01820 [Serratia phage vB_SmaM-Sureiya]